jgi:hypothetical protein
MLSSLAEKVQRGAILLDRYYPEWVEAIDIADLYMNSCTECILGQCFGRYTPGLKALHLDDVHDHLYPGLNDVDHGFDMIAHVGCSAEEWEELRQLWIKEIQNRLNCTKNEVMEPFIPNYPTPELAYSPYGE